MLQTQPWSPCRLASITVFADGEPALAAPLMSEPHVAKRSPGRPRRPPVSTRPISDIQAFWRLKSLMYDSYQSMRTVAFCAIWQRNGRSIAGVVEAGRYGRRTAYNRLRACREAGFEPDLVRFTHQTEDDWEAEDRHQVALIETFYREDVARQRSRPLLVRLLASKPRRYKDPMQED
jgi:hypothetical protein